MSRRDQTTSDAAAWALIAALVAGVVAMELRAPLWVDPWSAQALALACAGLSIAAVFYGRVRVRPNFSVVCTALMQMLIFTAIGSIFSYLITREGGALWDSTFERWDRLLGLEWLAYVRAVDARPWLVAPLRLAYASLIPQIVVLVLALGFTMRVTQLRQLIFAAMLTGTVTILLSAAFPAVSNYVHLGLTADDFRNVNPWAGYVHLADFNALRDGTMSVLQLPRMQGIVTFPSYHAGLAAVMLWGFWVSGMKWLRWSGSVVAIGTIVATPVDGGHYFVDVIAGVAIAVLCIALSARMIRWRPASSPLTALPFRRSRAAFAR